MQALNACILFLFQRLQLPLDLARWQPGDASVCRLALTKKLPLDIHLVILD